MDPVLYVCGICSLHPGKRSFGNPFFPYGKRSSVVSGCSVCFWNAGFSEILKCICISFMIGACISLAILISEHNFCERIRYFMSYLENSVKNKQILSYGKKDISLPENFHFTVPIFLSVLLYAGGIY